MADSGITRIDNLLKNPAEPPIDFRDDMETIGAIQDLLRGHGATGLPTLVSAAYGQPEFEDKEHTKRKSFTKRTLTAIHKFQKDHNLKVEDTISRKMLDTLILVPATTPLATRVYITLVLDQPANPALKILSLVAIVEGGGKFAAVAKNPDKAGLSLGIIQWAQKPGRLFELLDAWNQADPAEMQRLFGGAANVQAILDHAKAGAKELDANGASTNAKVNLLSADNVLRFKAALQNPKFQTAQVSTAAAAFLEAAKSLSKVAKKIKTERGFAFLLDLANQHGPGGAKSIYTAAVKDAMTEKEALEAMAQESVARIRKKFPPKAGEKESVFERGGRERREFYLHTNLLQDTPPPPPPPPTEPTPPPPPTEPPVIG
jgi:hypothetical protein